MTHKQAMEKIDFLNNRFRQMKMPWYKWAIKHSWNKINRWCEILGYKDT